MYNRLRNIWRCAKSRCCNPRNPFFKSYGGRGITFYDVWSRDYNSFELWAIQNGYREGLTLDRIDVNAGYSPDNCRWITNKEQQNNRRDNLFFTIDGVTKTLSEWCEQYGKCFNTVKKRLRKGMDIQTALSTPSQPSRKDLSGNKYGRLTVLCLHHIKQCTYFECRCDCGNTKVVRGADLLNGLIVSCGCYQKEVSSRNAIIASIHNKRKVLNTQTGEVYNSIIECSSSIGKSKSTVLRVLNKTNSYLKRL